MHTFKPESHVRGSILSSRVSLFSLKYHAFYKVNWPWPDQDQPFRKQD